MKNHVHYDKFILVPATHYPRVRPRLYPLYQNAVTDYISTASVMRVLG